MRRMGLMFALAVALASIASAHEGHVHRVMGTVAEIHENHLEVKATDGKVATFTLNDKTKVLRGKTPLKPIAIKIGERIVVTAAEIKSKDGKTILVAKQVNLPPATSKK